MKLFATLTIIVLTFTTFCQTKKTVVNIYSITTVTVGEIGRSIVGAQRLYLTELNNNDSRLSNYTFTIKVFDSKGSTIEAFSHALAMRQYVDGNFYLNDLILNENSTHKEVLLPILLGCPWSSLSVSTAPTLGVFNFGQISSSATSIRLSNRNNYPFFYRTVPADDVQARGIIYLCKLFNWDTIAVMYINNNYGINLALSVLSFALDNDIETYSVSFEEFDISSYQSAARLLSQLDVYIIVLISYSEVVYDIIQEALIPGGIFGYPYYYIGEASWFDSSTLKDYNLSDFVYGFIGTIPWQSNAKINASDTNYYSFETVFDESQRITNHFLSLWNQTLITDPISLYNITEPSIWAPYGWDSIDTIIRVLEKYQQVYSGSDGELGLELLWNNNSNTSLESSIVMNRLHRLIVNETNFLGATGNVSFNSNGDREQGLYLFGNIIDDNSTMEYFGSYYVDSSDNVQIISMSDLDSIKWPRYFVENNVDLPQASKITIYKVNTIDKSAVITGICLQSLTIVFVICHIVVIVYLSKCKKIDTNDERKKSVQTSKVANNNDSSKNNSTGNNNDGRSSQDDKSSDDKLNSTTIIKGLNIQLSIISCIGAVLLTCGGLLFGIDENVISVGDNNDNNDIDFTNKEETHSNKLNFICNSRIWLLQVSVTLLFMPLFCKLYRIAQNLSSKQILKNDKQITFVTFVCVAVDLVLLLIVSLMLPYYRDYENGNLKSIDTLQSIQYKYGICTCDNSFIVIIIIGSWKLIELLFGCYAAIIVSQIVGVREIMRLSETGLRVSSLFFTISLTLIIVTCYFFAVESSITFHYILIVVNTFLSVNIIIGSNIGFQLYYILFNIDNYQTPEEKINAWYKMMYAKSKRVGQKNGWIEKSEKSDSGLNLKQHFGNAKIKVKKKLTESLASGTSNQYDEWTIDDAPYQMQGNFKPLRLTIDHSDNAFESNQTKLDDNPLYKERPVTPFTPATKAPQAPTTVEEVALE